MYCVSVNVVYVRWIDVYSKDDELVCFICNVEIDGFGVGSVNFNFWW